MRSAFSSMCRLAGVAFVSLCAAAGVATAQDGGTLLKGRNVTPSNIIEALDPGGVRTRGLKLSRDGAGVSGPARKPSAALLITFETNSSELTADARQQLDVVGAALKNDRLAQYSFTVEGHADPRGTADGNQVLSEQRAQSVRSYLISTHDITPDRLRTDGRGDREPLNRAIPAAPENRRVRIVTQL